METTGNGLIVVDTNIIAYLLIRGERTAQAHLLFQKDPQWAAPAFWRTEFLNVLVSYGRVQGFTNEDLRGIWGNSYSLSHLREDPSIPEESLALAIRHKISGYDALFVALAKGLQTVCVTQDKALRKAAPQWTTTMDEFLN